MKELSCGPRTQELSHPGCVILRGAPPAGLLLPQLVQGTLRIAHKGLFCSYSRPPHSPQSRTRLLLLHSITPSCDDHHRPSGRVVCWQWPHAAQAAGLAAQPSELAPTCSPALAGWCYPLRDHTHHAVFPHRCLFVADCCQCYMKKEIQKSRIS